MNLLTQEHNWLNVSNGVKMDASSIMYNGEKNYTDISIDNGIKTVDFGLGFCSIMFDDCKKVFPEVELLKIGAGVKHINIPNCMFPNLKNIKCSGTTFISRGTLLIEKSRKCLVNAFNIAKNDVVDLKGIEIIEDYALTGCKSINFTNTEDVIYFEKKAFDQSFLNKTAKVQPLLTLGSLLVNISSDIKHLEIPKNLNITCVRSGLYNTDIKSLKIYDPDYISLVGKNINPEVLIIDTDKYIEASYFENFCCCNGLKEIKIINNPYFTSKEGIVYSKDESLLVFCPRGINNDIIIPEGVHTISNNAFNCSEIKSILLPNSLQKIGANAFSNCDKLSSIRFGNGLSTIGFASFSYCSALKNIDIPANIQYISEAAFSYCQSLESVELHEGLLSIGPHSFYRCPIKKISIPNSLTYLEYGNFQSVKEVYFDNILSPDILASIDSSEPRNAAICKIFLKGKEFLFLKNIQQDIKSRLALHMYLYPDDTAYADSIYKEIDNIQMQQEFVIELYKIRPTDEMRQFLKKSSNSIINRYLKEDRENALIEFLSFGIVTKSTINKVLKKAQEKNMMLLSAYALEELNKLKKPNKKFSI